MAQLTVYKQTLALTALCLLLPQCMAEKLNAFDMRVFSTSMKDISEKVNGMESLLTNTSKELVERFERTQNDVEGKLVSTNEGLKQLENTVLATVSSLESSMSAAREDLNTNKRQWAEGLTKMTIIESSLNATGQGMEENKRDLTNLLATVSSIQTSLSTTRDELSRNQMDWHDGLAKIAFIESSVNAFRNGMEDNKKDLANVLSTMIAIQSSLNAAREELTHNTRNWDNAMASIQSVESSVSSTRDEVAGYKKDLNDVSATISSLQSSVSATREDLNLNKNDWNNVKEVIPAIQSTLGATRTEVAELWKTVNAKKPRCKDGWYSFEDSCYFFSQAQMNWHSGRQRCQSMGSDYVKISSTDEFNFISNLLSGSSWTGMNDIDVEGTFKWASDNSQADINRAWFHRNEPNNSGDEDCIDFYNIDGTYLLNDYLCNRNDRKFICEMTPTVLLAYGIN